MTELPLPSPLRQRVFAVILICFAVFFGYGLVEFAYRAYLYYGYAVEANYSGVAIVDARIPPGGNLGAPGNVFGPYPPNTSFTMTQYAADNSPMNRHRVHINNLGWISDSDYTIGKSGDEYRIAFVGASLTASATNEHPWPDVVQRRLNEDHALLAQLGVRKISTVNLGLAGSMFQDMVSPGMAIARRFSPDFVVINFVTLSVLNAQTERPFAAVAAEPNLPTATPSAEPASVNAYHADLVVDGVEIWLSCPGGENRTVANPDCKVTPVWYAAPGREISASEFLTIKQDVARNLLLHRVLLSYRPLALLDILGRPVIPRVHAAEVPLGGLSDRRIGVALEAFGLAKDVNRNIMFAHDPLLWDPTERQTPAIINDLISLSTSRGFDVVRLQQYLPVQRGEKEWLRWYLEDGHWSDYGAEVYGEAMYHALRNRLLASRGIAAPTEDMACAASFAAFRDGEIAEANGDKDAAMTSFNAASAALPSDAEERFRHASLPEDCGFLPDLLAERSMLMEGRGDAAVAESDWEKALALAPDPFAYYQRRAGLRLARADLAGAIADQGEMIRLRPNDVKLYRDRGQALLKAGKPAEAIPDFTAALALQPTDVALMFNRAQAYSMMSDEGGVIADADRILALQPENAGVLFMRSGARFSVGQLEGALSDITAALKIMPGHPPFHITRATILERMGRTTEAAVERQAMSK